MKRVILAVVLVALGVGGATALGQSQDPTYDLAVKPQLGEVFVAQPVGRGSKIYGRAPGSDRFVPITDLRGITDGWVLNTCQGTVQLTQELDSQTHRIATATFTGGRFKVSQSKVKNAPTTLTLYGTTTCADLLKKGQHRATASAAEAKKAQPKAGSILGRLVASGKGRFRTKGRFASATVRGTRWITEDRTGGTYVKVLDGVVEVQENKTLRTHVLTKGRSILVKPS